MSHFSDFRPCIDIHEGKVKQIVGSTLPGSDNNAKDSSGAPLQNAVRENFVSSNSPAHFAKLYQQHGLNGGHVIMLGGPHPANKAAALEALKAYPGGLQIGGGITADNAREFIDAGASHVIVTSYVFKHGKINFERLQKLIDAVGGKHRVVLDLSCRVKRGDTNANTYYIVTDSWTKYTDVPIDRPSLALLSQYCSEFLIHAVDVEGKMQGIDAKLVSILANSLPPTIPATYAGGVRSLDDMNTIALKGQGRINVSVGSALDIFGGTKLALSEVIAWHYDKDTISNDDRDHLSMNIFIERRKKTNEMLEGYAKMPSNDLLEHSQSEYSDKDVTTCYPQLVEMIKHKRQGLAPSLDRVQAFARGMYWFAAFQFPTAEYYFRKAQEPGDKTTDYYFVEAHLLQVLCHTENYNFSDNPYLVFSRSTISVGYSKAYQLLESILEFTTARGEDSQGDIQQGDSRNNDANSDVKNDSPNSIPWWGSLLVAPWGEVTTLVTALRKLLPTTAIPSNAEECMIARRGFIKTLEVLFNSNNMRLMDARKVNNVCIAQYAQACMLMQPWTPWEKCSKANIENYLQPTIDLLLTVLTAGTYKKQTQMLTKAQITSADPLLIHFTIHAMEVSPQWSKSPIALHTARLLSTPSSQTYVPFAGHLLHMPSHIFALQGQWDEAIDANIAACYADLQAKAHVINVDLCYAAHDWHMLIYSALFAGEEKVAIHAARDLLAFIPFEEMIQIANDVHGDDGSVKKEGGGEEIVEPWQLVYLDMFVSMILTVYIRFGRWMQILEETSHRNSTTEYKDAEYLIDFVKSNRAKSLIVPFIKRTSGNEKNVGATGSKVSTNANGSTSSLESTTQSIIIPPSALRSAFCFSYAMVHYARALAYAATGDTNKAREEQTLFKSIRQAELLTPGRRVVHTTESFSVMQVRDMFLEGEILFREEELKKEDEAKKGQTRDADTAMGSQEREEGANLKNSLAVLEEASKLEKSLPYDEPWGIMIPVDHARGSLMIERASRIRHGEGKIVFDEVFNLLNEARTIFISDLNRYPHNSWAKVGLQNCLYELKTLSNESLSENESARIDKIIKDLQGMVSTSQGENDSGRRGTIRTACACSQFTRLKKRSKKT
eukprot:g2407.t1